ncbi:MAG: universal stress protein [Labrys sp. (in: a-proteobacteria)]
MSRTRIAYLPLATYPEAAADKEILAAAIFGASLGFSLSITTFAVDIPQISAGLLGDFLVDVPGLIHAAEHKSKAECDRLHTLVKAAPGLSVDVLRKTQKIALGTVPDAAAAEARYFDLSLLPWSAESVSAQDMMQAVVFGSGRPAILVPPQAGPVVLDHIAIAWDGSRVAARALGDALSVLVEGGRISVLTVQDEKPLSGPDLAGTLASSLEKRGFSAKALEIPIGARTVAEALQDTALSEGAQVLAMGGFGHSRIRDFILGGATNGVLTQLRLPALLSH